MTAEQTRDQLIGALNPESDLLVADHGDAYVNVAVMRDEEAVGVIAALMAPGWLTVMAPAIGYNSGLDADMIGQLFTQSTSLGPLRFFLAPDGAHLRMDIPLALGESVWLEAIRRLGRALHGLYDHDAAWMIAPKIDEVDHTVIQRWLNGREDIDAESLDEGQWRLLDKVGSTPMPVALEIERGLGLVRLMCGVVELSPDQFEPTRAATFMKLNDNVLGGKLVGVKEHGALMYMVDIPAAWATAEILDVYWRQLLNDQLVLRGLFSDILSSFDEALTRLLEEAKAVDIAEAELAKQLIGLTRGEDVSEEIDKHEALTSALFEIAEFLFRIIPRMMPQLMSVLPMHLETVALGHVSMSILPGVLETYWPKVQEEEA